MKLLTAQMAEWKEPLPQGVAWATAMSPLCLPTGASSCNEMHIAMPKGAEISAI